MKSFQVSFAILFILAVLASPFVVVACGAAQRAGRPIIDCAIDDRAAIIALGATFQAELERSRVEGRPIDWTRITREALDAGAEIGGCALARLVDDALDDLFGQRQGLAASPATLELAADARQALDRVRSHFGARYLVR